MSSIDPNDPNLVLSPLADPVAGAIFANAEVAGLASGSAVQSYVHKTAKRSGYSKIRRLQYSASKAFRKERTGFYKRFVLLVLYVVYSTYGKENRAGGGGIDTRIAGIC